MAAYNVIIIYAHDGERVLMCRRTRDPYCGLCNFVGGRVEPGETGADAALRELREETGIADVALLHVMDFQYTLENIELQVYAGWLTAPAELTEEVNPLMWISLRENFFDTSKFAGRGNIGHMLSLVQGYREAGKL
jgi:8-oxo-dGTP diphosphatase